MYSNSAVTKPPKVSVIVPVYNVEQYLRECIDSVLNQTFIDFELILVDDGSSDNCGIICDEYSVFDNRIKVIHKKNGGLSDARNAGLSFANGEYIYFLDGDDWIKDVLLERAVGCIKYKYDLVVFNNYISYSGDNQENVSHLTGIFDFCDESFNSIEFFIGRFLLSKLGWSMWNRLFNREIIELNSIRFADNNKIFLEDLFFSCCYYPYVKRIVSIQDRLFYYRQRSDSIMHTDGEGVNFNRINELGKELLSYYRNHPECNSYIEVFPQIYFKIFYNCLTSTAKVHEVGLKATYHLVIDDIQDKSFFREQMKALLSQRCVSDRPEDKKSLSEMKTYARFFLSGNIIEFKFRNRLNGLS